MADLSDSVNWFEIDNSNNKASPNGWPEGMMPSGVNDSARADKGALKRFWDRINPVNTITQAGGLWVFATSNTAYPTAYVDGEIYCFKAANDSVGNDQFQVNGLAAKPIWKRINTGTGWSPIIALDISGSLLPQLTYNSALNGGSGAFILLNPFVPITGDGTGGIGPITTTGLTIDPYLLYQSGAVFRIFHQSNGDRLTLDPAGNVIVTGNVSVGGSLYSTAHLYLAGQYIFFNNNSTNAQGPYIFADNSSFVWRLGSGNNAWIFQNNANSIAAQIDAVGDLIISATLTAALDVHARDLFANRNIWANAGAVTATYIHSTGNIVADVDVTARDLIATRNIWASSGAVTAAGVTSTGTVTGANVTATSTVTGANVTATSTVLGSLVHSTGNIQADGAFTGNNVTVGGNISTAGGNVTSAAGFVTRDGAGGYQFGFYQNGAGNVINFAPNSYLSYIIATGEFDYVASGNSFWMMRPGTNECWNNRGPTGGLGAYFNISDRRFKEDIEPSVRGLPEVLGLHPMTFRRVGRDKRETGFIAQDVEAVLPEAVSLFDFPIGTPEEPETTPTLVLTDSVIVAALVNAVKELAGRIVQLEGR